MEHNKESTKTTTVCVDAEVRNYLAAEAARLGLSQRQVVNHIVQSYKNQDDNPDANKGVERIISFLRQQEKMFLAPNLKASQASEMQIKILMEVLTEYFKNYGND